jgi:hypothetical protein
VVELKEKLMKHLNIMMKKRNNEILNRNNMLEEENKRLMKMLNLK